MEFGFYAVAGEGLGEQMTVVGRDRQVILRMNDPCRRCVRAGELFQ